MSEDKPLSQNLQQYHKAIEQEYATVATGTAEDLVKAARAKLYQLLDDAQQALETILHGAESEAVKMSAIKLVFEHTLGKPGSTVNPEDELQRLISTLTKDGPKSPQSS